MGKNKLLQFVLCVHIKKAISLENHSDIIAKSCLRKKVQCKCNYDY